MTIAFILEISKHSNPSVLTQYYYAHNQLNFSTEGAKHFKGDGKIYGGDPVLIRQTSIQEKKEEQEAAAKAKATRIGKFSWSDEESKVKIYIDTN